MQKSLIPKEKRSLITGRLKLTPLAKEHISFLHALWTDPDVRRFLWDDRAISRDEAAAIVEASGASFDDYGFGMWLVSLRESAKPVGFCGLRHFSEALEVEILYGLLPRYWGLGLATEAAREVLRFAFSNVGLAQVFAGADSPNAASIRVMDRLGMTFDSHRVVNNLPAVYYSINRQTFERLF